MKDKKSEILKNKNIICHLTCVTIHPSPSRFTFKTRSTLYVTRVVFTIGGAWRVTVSTVETSIITSCVKWKQVKNYQCDSKPGFFHLNCIHNPRKP